MSKQLLIYETAVPVNSGRHAKACVEVDAGFAFARTLTSVPLTAVEFAAAATEYAIVFTGAGDGLMPVAILGARADENIFLTGDHTWSARYIPAFVRRYPFVLAASEDQSTFTLCIDEAFPGFNPGDRGQRLFDDAGNPTEYTNEVLRFVQEYQAQFQRTQALCQQLQSLNLLESMQAEFNLTHGEKLSLNGFTAVNRSRLKELPAETLAELMASDALELIFLHLASLGRFEDLKERLAAERPVAPAA